MGNDESRCHVSLNVRPRLQDSVHKQHILRKRKESRSAIELKFLCLPAQRLTAGPNRFTYQCHKQDTLRCLSAGWDGSVCNRFPTPVQTVTHTNAACYPPLRQLCSDFGHFNKGVCPVMKITIVESIELFTQQTFWCSGTMATTTTSMAWNESHGS